MKKNSIGAFFEHSEVIDTCEVENAESLEASPEAIGMDTDMDMDNDGLLSDETLEGVQEQLDVSDKPAEFIGELDSRKRHDIELDLHEAKAKLDFHSRRQVALAGSGLYMAYGEHERAAKSWGHRVAKLQDELKKCKD